MWRPAHSHLAVIALLSATPIGLAHQPTISDGTAVDAEHAIEFVDPQISRVVYHEVTAEAPQVWVTFEVDQPQALKIQLGVPLIDRLEDFRPAFALLGPGLPSVELPFTVPEGLGGSVFESGNVTEPEVFDEPFTGTTSWILRDEEVQLPAAGRYYVVAYVPSGEQGKLWVALGVEEVFELDDILTLPEVIADVRAFHEVPARVGPACFLLPAGLLLTAVPIARRLRR
jgi:hypothetical protein